jgi:vitamin K-dependent gamma-carboxylase
VEAGPRTDASERYRFADALFAPTDIAVLVYFRVAFGVLIAWHGVHDILVHHIGKVLHAQVLFTYWPFTFVKPLPSPVLYGVEYLLVIAGAFVAVGLYYRVSATAVFAGVTYLFLLDQGNYLNHLYLVGLLAFLMIFLPANRQWSLDALFDPSIRRDTVPAWTVWLLRFQVAVPYFFGGIAKLNADWFRGEPLRTMLLQHRDFPLLGQFFTNGTLVEFFIWGSIALELVGVFLLLNRYTRVPTYLAFIAFHLMNARFFHIDIFPWMMIGATAVFFPADWPRRVVKDFRTRPWPRRLWCFVIGFAIVATLSIYLPTTHAPIDPLFGGIGGGVAGYYLEWPHRRRAARAPTGSAARWPHRPVVVGLLAAWVAFQAFVPLRHFLIPGNVYWTGEGQEFSWHMMLRNKTGTTTFVLRNPANGKTQDVDPGDFLSPTQLLSMTGNPDMTVQFAHYLSERAQRELHLPTKPQVFVRTMISLNLRPPQPFIDPHLDLATVKRPLIGHQSWILPLHPRTSRPHQHPSPQEVNRSGSASAG